MASGKRKNKSTASNVTKVKVDHRKLVFIVTAAAVIVLGALGILEFNGQYVSTSIRLITILYFCVICFGLGYSMMRLSKVGDAIADGLEYLVMTAGLGLSVFPIVIVLLNTLHIPLAWWVMLAISIALPLKDLISFRGQLKGNAAKLVENIKKQDIYPLLVVLIAVIVFFVFIKASFREPYLEDGDTWAHAVGIKYVSVAKTYDAPPGLSVSHYIAPYPPALDTLMGVLVQLDSSVYWTMKFFTQVLVALGIVFCYFFVKELTGNSRLAMFSSFILSITPPYLSHVTWAHAYSIVQFFPLFYFIEKARKNSSWNIPAVFSLAGSLIIQPLFSLVNGILYGIYLIVFSLKDKGIFKRFAVMGAAGLIISLLFWIPEFHSAKGETVNAMLALGTNSSIIHFGANFMERAYGVGDFDFVEPTGDIFTHKGLGLVYVLLVLIAVVLPIVNQKYSVIKNPAHNMLLAWTAFIFIAIESWVLPVSVFPYRFWGILPITVAILAAEGLLITEKLLEKAKEFKTVALIIIILGLGYTSAYPRYLVQTATWPPGTQWNTQEQLGGYVSLFGLKPDTRVFTYCTQDYSVIGFDMLDFPWDYEVNSFRMKMADKVSVNELYGFLKGKDYDYLIFDSGCAMWCGEYSKYGKNPQTCIDNINHLVNDSLYSNRFSQAESNKGFLLLKIN